MLRKVKKRYSVIRDKIKHFKFKNTYSDNIDEENDYDDLEFVWGIKSCDGNVNKCAVEIYPKILKRLLCFNRHS